MEHVQPINRSFSWRPVTLALALLLAVALMAVGALMLLFRAHGTRPVADPARASKGQVAMPHLRPLRPRSRISVLVLNGNGSILAHNGDELIDILRNGQTVFSIVALAGVEEQVNNAIRELRPVTGDTASGEPPVSLAN